MDSELFVPLHASLEEEEDERAYEPEEKVNVIASETLEERLNFQLDETHAYPFSWKKLWLFTGPGFLMSIAYLDPGNIESDLQTGAQTGYTLLWILFWATAMGLFFQLLASRLGVATECHLAELCHVVYPKPVRWTLWILAEIAIIGSDIQEVIGSAIAIRILSQGSIPLWAGVLITASDCFIILFLESYGVRKLEAVFGCFIAIMAISFARIFWEAKPDIISIAKGLLIPSIPSSTLTMAVGIVGAVVMPHNIFLHSALVQSRAIDRTNHGRIREALMYNSIESSLALFISFIINLFIVSVFAKLFYQQAVAEDIGLVNAGTYLQEAYGSSRFPVETIWAVGLLAAGQSSTMTGTYAGQFVMSGFLDLHIPKWTRVLVTRGVAICPTILVALTFNQNDTELDKVNEYLNVLQSVQLPFALLPLIQMVASKNIMGIFVIRRIVKWIAMAFTALVVLINVYFLFTFCVEYLPPGLVWPIAIIVLLFLLYFGFVTYLIIGPDFSRDVNRFPVTRGIENDEDHVERDILH